MLRVNIKKHTGKTSTNSSKSSSQSPKDETALNRAGANGKGKAHNGVAAGNTHTLRAVEVAEVAVREGCGEDLGEAPGAALSGAPASTPS